MSKQEQVNFLVKLFFIPITLLATLFMFSVLPWGDLGRMITPKGIYASSVDHRNNPSYNNGSSATFSGSAVQRVSKPMDARSIERENTAALRDHLKSPSSLKIIEKKTVEYTRTTYFKFTAKNSFGVDLVGFAAVEDGKVTDIRN